MYFSPTLVPLIPRTRRYSPLWGLSFSSCQKNAILLVLPFEEISFRPQLFIPPCSESRGPKKYCATNKFAKEEKVWAKKIWWTKICQKKICEKIFVGKIFFLQFFFFAKEMLAFFLVFKLFFGKQKFWPTFCFSNKISDKTFFCWKSEYFENMFHQQNPSLPFEEIILRPELSSPLPFRIQGWGLVGVPWEWRTKSERRTEILVSNIRC